METDHHLDNADLLWNNLCPHQQLLEDNHLDPDSPGFLLSKAFGTDLHHETIFRWHQVRHICDQWIQDQQPRKLLLGCTSTPTSG
ncbi:hypothetical protein TNCV_2322631 [Trichonephila clavipes]|nr:hypothetical protein TNCV_2322631 [Trichonephila clavipes]